CVPARVDDLACVGVERYEGFDREQVALASARQSIGQLEDQIRANEKQRREDIANSQSEQATEDDVKRLLAHANSLLVTNSLLAARVDQMNLQAKYLMQDQKKVGPNLKDVR